MDIAQGLITALKTACQIFNKSGIGYCLAGGLAVSLLTRPRATEDVDFIILVEEREQQNVEALLRIHFDIVQSNEVMHFKNASIWRMIISDQLNSDGLIILDMIFADRPEFRRAVENAFTIELDGVEISVISPVDLIAVKRLAGRPIDLLDIEAIQQEYDQDSE